MGYAHAKTMHPDTIPVIDIGPLRSNTDSQSVAEALHKASKGLGFIYIRGHGIADDTINNARTAAYDFFRSSESDKASVAISPQHRGWLKPGAAKMDDDAKVDLKESFIWGLQDQHGNTEIDHPLRGPNQWPAFAQQMEAAAMDYFVAAHEVAAVLMQAFATSLQLDKNYFLQTSDKPLSRASFVYYPAQPEDSSDEQFGVGPHTDFGVLTVLCQDDTGGLQVQDVNGDWIHAPPIADTLVVNVGDLLCRWTNGEYKSTPHRVVNTSGQERLSLVLAFDPNPETVIDARLIPDLEVSAESCEEPITCGDYLQWRFAKAFSYRTKDAITKDSTEA